MRMFASVASQSSQHPFFLCSTSSCIDFAARWDQSLSLTKVSAAANTGPGGSNTLETVCPMKTLIFVEQTANVGVFDSYLFKFPSFEIPFRTEINDMKRVLVQSHRDNSDIEEWTARDPLQHLHMFPALLDPEA